MRVVALVLTAMLQNPWEADAFQGSPPSSVTQRSLRMSLSGLRCQSQQPCEGAPMASRRSVLGAAAGAGLLGQSFAGFPLTAEAEGRIPRVPDDGREHNVVITGANSGIGKDAAIKMAAGGYNVYIPCRNIVKAQAAKADIDAAVAALAPGGKAGSVTAMVCDLTSLNSVRAFAQTWKGLGKTLDILVLNAGVAPSTSAKPPAPHTTEGFETTIATNHLSHFLMANLLLPDLEAAPGSPRLVVTASQVHDPSTPGGDVGSKATLGNLAGLESGAIWDMVDGGAYDPDKAYKDSKLCNVLFSREMARRLQAKGSKVSCNCFSPGLITRTGLFRDQGQFFVALFDFAVYNLIKVGETVSFGGDCLVTMATGEELEGKQGVFWSNSKPGKHVFEEVGVSKEAQNDQEAAKLWALSAKAVGLASTV